MKLFVFLSISATTAQAFFLLASPGGGGGSRQQNPSASLLHVQQQPSNNDSGANSDNNNNASSNRDRQEQFMEVTAAQGADKISNMCVAERTKRVMLAETVEDRIFQLQDDLDSLLKMNNDNNNASNSNNNSIIPEDEELRSKCVDIAKQIKAAQKQYKDLVSGDESEMLTALNSLGTLGQEQAPTGTFMDNELDNGNHYE